MKVKTLIIQANSRHSEIHYLNELFQYRDVFFMLGIRDIKLRYTQTVLGVFWVILQPLLTAFFFSIIFGRFARLPSEGLPYLLFVFSGLTPWMFFSQALQRASMSLLQEERLITKIYFPRIIIPLSSCAGVVIDLCVCLAFMAALLIFYHIAFTWKIFLLPLFFLLTLIFTSGISLFFAAMNVYYRDFKHLVPYLLQFWMYACPIMYSTTLIPQKWQLLYHLNPMTGIVDCYRFCFIGSYPFPWISCGISVICSFIVFTIGMYVFRKIERYFADVI
ncbi:MAG: ABC transporter permease [Chlamydiae bacterium]|nr:ABC transporter permease [Chlamydiota bacterium]